MFPKAFLPLLLAGALFASAQSQPSLVALGDSLGEGVQSGDASTYTQPNGYVNLLSQQMNAGITEPLIKSWALGFVGTLPNRTRVDPTLAATNVATSGANTHDVIYTVSQTPAKGEVDLVLAPRVGVSQLQVAESNPAKTIVCFIGSNDVLGTILSWNHLDASQITPLEQFTQDYTTLAQRLKATGARVVLGTIPNVAYIGFAMNNDDLTHFTGTNYNLPAGSYTTLPTMLLLKLGVFKASILQNPSYVLDSAKINTIQTAIDNFNLVIRQQAAANGFALADVNAIFNAIVKKPPVINGISITSRFNGGVFSLDGVHTSNTGSATLANAFIGALNARYNMGIPPLSLAQQLAIFKADPFIDPSGNHLRVPGRPYKSLLESLGPFLGISGGAGAAPVNADAFMHAWSTAAGKAPKANWTAEEAEAAVSSLFPSRF